MRGLKSEFTLSPGAEVTSDRPLGTITSAVDSPEFGPIGLAILRAEAKPGHAVAVHGQSATVVELPFTH